MSETTTTTETTTEAEVVLTLAEQTSLISEGERLALAEEETEALIGETVETLRVALTPVRRAMQAAEVAGDAIMRLRRAVIGKNSHPDWAGSSPVSKLLAGKSWDQFQASYPAGKRPSDEEVSSLKANVRQAINRKSRETAILAYVRETVNGAKDEDEAGAKFKGWIRAEYLSAGINVPGPYRTEADTQSANGAGPSQSDPSDVYRAAVAGVAGLYDPKSKTGVTHSLQVAALLTGIATLGERVTEGEITERPKVSLMLDTMGDVLSLIQQRVTTPETFGESETDKLAEAIKTARKLAESARK